MQAARPRLLPPILIDRIAAGEVIERPAAVLKELVENALDAGASRIAVEIEEGGIGRIAVSDDGSGIAAEDLALAVQRHATSKLADDTLVQITTLGFRGEALPSIGAVARMSLVSRVADAAHASRILVTGGEVGAVEPAAGAKGTSVEIRDLFFATPARRKFLKSARAEADAAELALRRLALAAPGIGFHAHRDGREILALPPQSRRERVEALFGTLFGALSGAEMAACLLALDETRGALRLEGLIGTPSLTRATSAAQGFIVNGRPVTDPLLRTALKLAYRDVMEAGRHPVAVLYLSVPPDQVDVNVHPAKHELRFSDPDSVRGLLIGAIRRVLAGPAGPAARRIAPPRAASIVYPAPHGPAANAQANFAEAAALPLLARPPDPAPDPAAHHRLGAAVAQVLETYVIAVTADDGLVLVDQHAAHERLTHEALSAERRNGRIASQPLLLPVVVELAAREAEALVEQQEALAALGLAIEAFGVGAVLVRGLPALLQQGTRPDIGQLVRDLADEFAETGCAVTLEARLDGAIARLACHGSVRAGRRLNAAEMNALLRQMEATPRAATCSHGRPTFLRLERSDLERMFGRRKG